MTRRLNNKLLLAFMLIAFGAGLFKAFNLHPSKSFQPPAQGVEKNSAAIFQSSFVSSKQNVQTHASSVIELKDGRLRAFWFSGSREGAGDVEIHSAVFDPARGQWSTEQAVVSREDTQRSLMRYVKKLGNPVPARAADGTLWLYYVTVSMGGWAGSSITAITSADEGETWSPARRLITSPFLNISTLLKGAPISYSDGTMGLPVYHEFISKFGELLHLDASGRVLDKQRLTAGGNGALQPVMLVKNPTDALVLMRYAGPDAPHRAISVATRDAGQHWTAPAKSALLNPDSALAALVLPDGRMLAVLNNIEQQRDALSLMVSADGGVSWKTVYPLEDQLAERKQPLDNAHFDKILQGLVKDTDASAANVGSYVASTRRTMCGEQPCHFEFSYPYMIQARNGDIHLVYTWNRSFIKHVRFDQAWLDRHLEKMP